MFKNKKSLLSKFILAKDEFVSMKLHFRYHTYLYTKKRLTVHDGCKYCLNRLVHGTGKEANENKGERSGELF